jgi:D-alanyl-D-alanine carboxypeptidase
MRLRRLVHGISLTLIFLLIFGGISVAEAGKSRKSEGPNLKYASVVLDMDTGLILHQENANKVLHPASLTKLMTLMLVFEALDSGRLHLSDRIPISRRAASMSPSKLGLKPGQTIKVQDAIYAVVTKSANDIAVALAEAVGGSESQFARRMNLKAQDIGMMHSYFVNASGLHNPRQVSSALDMAKLAQHILTVYPHHYHVFSKKNFVYGGRSYHNHNRLMNTYAGMDGMKTGYVAASGFNLVASAKRGGHRIVGVVFGGKSAVSRNQHMEALLNAGFTKSAQIRIAAARGIPIPQMASLSPSAQTQPFASQTAPQAIEPASGATSSAAIVASVTSVDIPLPPRRPGNSATGAAATGTLSPPQYQAVAPSVQAVAFHQPSRPVPAQQPHTLGTLRLGDISQGQPSPEHGNLPESWAVQIGAFQNRQATDLALYQAIQRLPAHLNRAMALIVPLRTTDAAWVFRARLSGYTREQANEACRYLPDCLMISPQAN